MREIKFRAYDKLNKIYITDELILYNECWFDGFRALEDYCALDVDSGNVVIHQFTGLHDKKGNEIYEGDVLKSEDGNFEVIFKNGSFGIVKEEKYSFYSDEVVEKFIPLRNIEFYNMGVDND